MDKKILLIGICDDEKEALNQIAESIKESIREMELPVIFEWGRECTRQSKKMRLICYLWI